MNNNSEGTKYFFSRSLFKVVNVWCTQAVERQTRYFPYIMNDTVITET